MVRTRIRNLVKLSAVKKDAIFVGPWKLARTYGTQSGLTNRYLKEQGLVSVKELWVAFPYPNG